MVLPEPLRLAVRVLSLEVAILLVAEDKAVEEGVVNKFTP